MRAIALNLAIGEHGLPLMGTGDWNDGMSLVGAGGKGESVWLGWFLLSILRPFADVAAARGEQDRAEVYRRHATELDEGARTGLGRRMVPPRLLRRWDAARIEGERRMPHRRDRAVVVGLSAGADPARARQAMESAEEHLVRRDDGIDPAADAAVRHA